MSKTDLATLMAAALTEAARTGETRFPASWSDAVARQLALVVDLFVRAHPQTQDRIHAHFVVGTQPGADGRIEVLALDGHVRAVLLVELERYASGRGFAAKLRAWLRRHRAARADVVRTLVVALLAAVVQRHLAALDPDGVRRGELAVLPCADFVVRADGARIGGLLPEVYDYLWGWLTEHALAGQDGPPPEVTDA